MKWTYSFAPQAAGCSLSHVEMAESESLGHPGGMQDISRWLSVSDTTGQQAPLPFFQEPRQGFRTRRFPLTPESRTPAGVPERKRGHPFPVVSLTLNHRLMALTPPG